MLRIAVIGGGNHSNKNHLPALSRYISLYPDKAEFAAFCDLCPEVAEGISRQYGVNHVYTNLEEMLAAERLDGCIAVTPIPVTARVAIRIISAGIPLLMEKPPGATLKEAEEIRAVVENRQARVMVSMNRRFDPVVCAACAWNADTTLEYVRATMLRHDRREADFFVTTAIHCVDTVRRIAGNVRDYSVNARQVDGVWWYHIELTFQSEATGTLDILPNCGTIAESYELFGAEYRMLACVGGVDSGKITRWEAGEMVGEDEPTQGMPAFVKNGTYDETREFISSILENRDPHPSPTEVWQSVELCHHIQHEFSQVRI